MNVLSNAKRVTIDKDNNVWVDDVGGTVLVAKCDNIRIVVGDKFMSIEEVRDGAFTEDMCDFMRLMNKRMKKFVEDESKELDSDRRSILSDDGLIEYRLIHALINVVERYFNG